MTVIPAKRVLAADLGAHAGAHVAFDGAMRAIIVFFSLAFFRRRGTGSGGKNKNGHKGETLEHRL